MCGRFAQDRTKIPPALLALLTEQYVVKEPDYLRVTETATAVKPDEPIGRTLFDSLGDEPEPVAPKREWSPVSYNVRPMQRVLVARTIEADPDKNTPERTEMADLYWRLIPRWVKNIKEFKGSTINARSEELEEKSTWKGLVKKQRCLVPMIGFYEPQRFGNEKDPFSIPWFIYQKTGEPFCVGGLWEHMYDVPTDTLYESFTILTTAENPLISRFHDRFPWIVPPEHYGTWLNPANNDTKALKKLFGQTPPEQLTAHPCTKLTDYPKSGHGPECIEPLDGYTRGWLSDGWRPLHDIDNARFEAIGQMPRAKRPRL